MTTPFTGIRRIAAGEPAESASALLSDDLRARITSFPPNLNEYRRILPADVRLLIIARVLRRIHIRQNLATGVIQLDDSQAHHLRDVLRMKAGDPIEAFDDAGSSATGIIERCEPTHVSVRIERLNAPHEGPRLIIASAVPKGERADWMIEKLSELGVHRFIPLETDRSVVLPKGRGKHERWQRIAAESAKQSRRVGVMQIEELTPLDNVLGELPQACFLSTGPDAQLLTKFLFDSQRSSPNVPRAFLIGPEGGWSDEELAGFKSSGLTGLKLTGTILRVETAAIVAAAIVSAWEENK